MRVRFEKDINYFEIDAHSCLRLGVLFKLLQETAIIHTERVGLGTELLRKQGVAWILNKFGVDIYRYPAYGQSIEVVTWAIGLKGFKAYRNFEVLAEKQRIAAAETIWFYLDINRKRVRRIPPEYNDIYTLEPGQALQRNIDLWKPQKGFVPDFILDVTTRNSDYDPNGHVNNAVYADYLDTAVTTRYGDHARIKRLDLQFTKEIDRVSDTIQVGLKNDSGSHLFKIFRHETLYACGEFLLET